MERGMLDMLQACFCVFIKLLMHSVKFRFSQSVHTFGETQRLVRPAIASTTLS